METMSGEVRSLTFEDGLAHGPDCGDDECLCADHDGPPRPEGTYITIRLDGSPRVAFGRVRVEYEAATNGQ